ncbi:MAG: PAS domain S-box protein [Deltaproteobacteria bacterium]|nr:PAS domain S-box protein [Deltaproteobacteria bacterium]
MRIMNGNLLRMNPGYSLYVTVVEAAPNAMVMVDQAGKIVLMNSQAEKLFGYCREELMGQSIELLIPGPMRASHSDYQRGFFANPTARPMGAGRDLIGLRKDGGTVAVEIGLNPLTINEGTFVLASIIDITERKRAEEQIKASLKEKEVLLKEIHHRVKNNLQIISSMLNLQAKSIKDPKALEMFRESQSRVRSIALIHEELYQSRDLSRLDFTDHVQSLVSHLFRSYGVHSDRIVLRIHVEEAYLDVDTAIPCGLIINELVSNSLKYAFPEGKKGEISIDLRRQHDDHYMLVVRDNGVGLPKNLDFRNTETLGLQLVNTLTEQIDGSIELGSSAGTEVKVTFTALSRQERRHDNGDRTDIGR